MDDTRYIPALRFRWLTRIYDPLMERWTAATQMREAVIKALDLRPGLRLLELGSGPRRLAIQIRQRYSSVSFEGIDADPAMVALARQNAEVAGIPVTFRRSDITALRDGELYDRIYSTLVFHHLTPEGKVSALRWVRRSLRTGGRFVVADFGRPDGWLRWITSHIIQPLDGIANTAPHRSGEFERMLRAEFARADVVAAWPTFAGTLKVIACVP